MLAIRVIKFYTAWFRISIQRNILAMIGKNVRLAWSKYEVCQLIIIHFVSEVRYKGYPKVLWRSTGS